MLSRMHAHVNPGETNLWAAVFTFNPYLLISINELLISIIHLLILNVNMAAHTNLHAVQETEEGGKDYQMRR